MNTSIIILLAGGTTLNLINQITDRPQEEVGGEERGERRGDERRGLVGGSGLGEGVGERIIRRGNHTNIQIKDLTCR